MKSTVRKFKMKSILRSMKRIWTLHYEFADARINCFTWWKYSRWFIYFFLRFLDVISKKQHMYHFLPFGFINVIMFVINPSSFYSTYIGADFEYPNLLRFDRGRWSELRYFNFKSSLKMWWRSAGDFDGSQILVTRKSENQKIRRSENIDKKLLSHVDFVC